MSLYYLWLITLMPVGLRLRRGSSKAYISARTTSYLLYRLHSISDRVLKFLGCALIYSAAPSPYLLFTSISSPHLKSLGFSAKLHR